MYKYKGVIDRVVDADTVDATLEVGFGISVTQRFRINNYDAPETWRPRNAEEKKHGLEATERAKELLVEKVLVFESSKIPGIYGRYSATIWLEDERNFVEVMISEGFSKRKSY